MRTGSPTCFVTRRFHLLERMQGLLHSLAWPNTSLLSERICDRQSDAPNTSLIVFQSYPDFQVTTLWCLLPQTGTWITTENTLCVLSPWQHSLSVPSPQITSTRTMRGVECSRNLKSLLNSIMTVEDQKRVHVYSWLLGTNEHSSDFIFPRSHHYSGKAQGQAMASNVIPWNHMVTVFAWSKYGNNQSWTYPDTSSN